MSVPWSQSRQGNCVPVKLKPTANRPSRPCISPSLAVHPPAAMQSTQGVYASTGERAEITADIVTEAKLAVRDLSRSRIGQSRWLRPQTRFASADGCWLLTGKRQGIHRLLVMSSLDASDVPLYSSAAPKGMGTGTKLPSHRQCQTCSLKGGSPGRWSTAREHATRFHRDHRSHLLRSRAYFTNVAPIPARRAPRHPRPQPQPEAIPCCAPTDGRALLNEDKPKGGQSACIVCPRQRTDPVSDDPEPGLVPRMP